MMNVTKRLSAMLAAMIMVFCTPLFVFAAGQTELRDDAELFTSEEETQLQAELDAFAQSTSEQKAMRCIISAMAVLILFLMMFSMI